MAEMVGKEREARAQAIRPPRAAQPNSAPPFHPPMARPPVTDAAFSDEDQLPTTFGASRPLTLKTAMRKVEAHDFACVNMRGLQASIRRACSTQMQMPKSMSTETSHVVTAVIPNVPRQWATSWLLSLGWKSVAPPNTLLCCTHAEYKTDYPKAIGEMLTLQSLDGVTGHAGAKLYKPQKEPKAKALLAAIPPGRAVHRIRDDHSEVLEITFHLGIINEVSDVRHCLPLPKLPACVNCVANACELCCVRAVCSVRAHGSELAAQEEGPLSAGLRRLPSRGRGRALQIFEEVAEDGGTKSPRVGQRLAAPSGATRLDPSASPVRKQSGRYRTPPRGRKRGAVSSPAPSSGGCSTGGSTASVARAELTMVTTPDGSPAVVLSLRAVAVPACEKNTAVALAEGDGDGDGDVPRLRAELARITAQLKGKASALRARKCQADLLESAMRHTQREYGKQLQGVRAHFISTIQGLRNQVYSLGVDSRNLRWARKSQVRAVLERDAALAANAALTKQLAAAHDAIKLLQVQLGKSACMQEAHRGRLAMATKNSGLERREIRAAGKQVSAMGLLVAAAEQNLSETAEQLHYSNAEAELARCRASELEAAFAALENKHAHALDNLATSFQEQKRHFTAAVKEARDKEEKTAELLREQERHSKEWLPPSLKGSGDYSRGGERWARKMEIDYLTSVFEYHDFRPQSVASILEVFDLVGDVFSSRQFWPARMGWLREVLASMKEQHWNAQKATAIIVGLNLSERAAMELRNMLGKLCEPRFRFRCPPPYILSQFLPACYLRV